MRPDYVVMLADMMNRVDLSRVSVHAALGITPYRIVLPTALPQFIGNIEVLVGPVIARIVMWQAAVPQARCGIGQIRRDDIPRHPSTRQMVEGGELPRKGKRMRLQHRAGKGKTEVLRAIRHGRD